MTTIPILALTLEEFLKKTNIDESPAWEYINGEVIQKPMPKTHHSRLQLKLASAIKLVTEASQVALAFPELRCTFGGRSLVADIAVVYWDKIPLNDAGEPENSGIFFPPDWAIEILSPNKKLTKVIDNIIHCLQYGSQLAWLIDPDEKSIIVFQPQQTPRIYKAALSNDETPQETLPVLDKIELNLTANKIFSWLQMKIK